MVSVALVLGLIVAGVIGRALMSDDSPTSDSPPTSASLPIVSRFTCYTQIPAKHVGDIWLSIHPAEQGRPLLVTLRWGSKIAKESVDRAMSLSTIKGSDHQPLTVQANGTARMSCGIGAPPDEMVRDINGDWS